MEKTLIALLATTSLYLMGTTAQAADAAKPQSPTPPASAHANVKPKAGDKSEMPAKTPQAESAGSAASAQPAKAEPVKKAAAPGAAPATTRK